MIIHSFPLLSRENLGNLDHKMWGVAPITAPVVHCDIRPFEKSTLLLVCSPAAKAFFTEFRQTSPSRLKLSKSHDWIYSNQDRDIDDYYQLKSCIFIKVEDLCISEVININTDIFYQLSTLFFNSVPTLKNGNLFGFTAVLSPVFGFLPL
jgi:hypothetical protein